MKNYIKQFLFRGLCGIFIGSFIGHTIYAIYALQMEVLQLTPSGVLVNYFATALVGFWCSSISIVYTIDEWSLLKQTVTHSLLLLPYIPFAFYLGWVPDTFLGKIIFILAYILAYILIWFSFKLYWTRRANELNRELERFNKS